MGKRFRGDRENASVMDHAGWKRAWLVISAGIFVLIILFALQNPNVLNVSISSSSLDCVPGTYSESAVPGAAFYQPARARIEDGAGQVAGTGPGDSTAAQDGRGASRDQQITTFSCTSYLGLVLALAAAALLSLGIAFLFRLTKWLYRFRKQ